MIPKRDFFSKVYKFLKNSKLKPLLGVGQRLAAEGEVYSGLRKFDDPPILVYQMGKVGSTTVSYSLNVAGIENYVYDIHFLSNDLIKYRNLYIDSGIVPVPYHIDLGMALRKRIIKNKLKNLKIISLVRDPIARQVSDIFQNPEIMETDIRNPDGLFDKNKALALLEDKFSDFKVFDYVFEWFDRELKSVFDIDVFSHPFDCDSGWSLYGNGKVEALVIRLEDLSRVGDRAISDFLGTPQKIALVSANVRSETHEAGAYRFVKNNLKIDRSFCEKVYKSKFVRHFYSGDQIENMINKWV